MSFPSIKSLKPICFGIFTALSLWAAPALAQGTIPLAMAQQLDANSQVLSGCLLNFFVAGTVATPQNAFADFGLTQPLPNPVRCDQTGRVPMFWLANGLIHIRLTDATGVVIIDTTMQVLGPSSGGGGGGGTVDPTTILATGDEKIRYGTGPLTGFVRENGLTIGSAVSGATERANADTQNLFVYLYGTDPNLVVSGGRTGNALNDFNANKTIALPDMRGRINAFLDDMGNTTAGRLAAPFFTTPTTLGSAGGSQSQTLTLGQLPTGITSSGLVTVFANGSVGDQIPFSGSTFSPINVTASGTNPVPSASGINNTSTISGQNTLTSTNTGGQATPILPPIMLRTQYIKL
jgi:hypothetical protein